MRVKRAEQCQQYYWPVDHKGTEIVDGALLMPGVTAETDLGALIVAATAGADAIGTCIGKIATTEDNTNVAAGTPWLTWPVSPVWKGVIVEADYDLTDTMAIASMQSTTSVRVSSIEDNIDSSWLYCTSGTGAGELHYVTADDGTDLTLKSAATYAASATLIKILRLFHQLAKLNTAADKIGTDAAAGSWTILVLQNWLTTVDLGPVALNPTKHDGLTGLNATGRGTRFYADIGIRNAGQNTID